MNYIYVIIRKFVDLKLGFDRESNFGYCNTLQRATELTISLNRKNLETNKESPLKITYYYQKVKKL